MKNEKLPPTHPGEILIEEFLKPMGISQYRLAKGIKNVSASDLKSVSNDGTNMYVYWLCVGKK